MLASLGDNPLIWLQDKLCISLQLPETLGDHLLPQGKCFRKECNRYYFIECCKYTVRAQYIVQTLHQYFDTSSDIFLTNLNKRFIISFCSLKCALNTMI